MEKSYRLILKNLSSSVKDEKISELFSIFGKVEKVELKEKKDAWESDKINRFAFVTINTSDKNLNTCFREVNETLIEGNRLHVEIAKESFLQRVQREREEVKEKKEGKVIEPKFEPNNSKPIEFNNAGYINQQSKFKSHITETSETNEKHFVKPKKFYDTEESFTENENFTNYVEPDYDDYKEKRKRRSEFLPPAAPDKRKSFENKFNETVGKKGKQINVESPVISESERKRLASLKAKKEAFKAKEQAVRNALKMVDTTNRSKKIIFDDLESTEDNETSKKRKLCWESDEEEEEFKFPDDSELNSKSKTMFSKLQSTTGNDKRFTLDERFMEDEDKEEETVQEEETEIAAERKMQLGILEDVLGNPISTEMKNHNDRGFKRANMIRYDPTEESHHQYEIAPQKPEKLKKQIKSETENVKEAEPLPVSKEVFYSVSDKLTSVLAEGENFSVLKMLGKESTDPSIVKPEIPYICEPMEQKFGFNFDSNKAFKYDSSDDEEPNADSSAKGNKFKSERDSSHFYGKDDKFLFALDDPRFKECEEFFSKRSEQSEDLKTLRPILKQTIRKRIQTNMKKNNHLFRKKQQRKETRDQYKFRPK
ncbi:probable RNA-binding protein CG14230 isoform X2 [Belonocnema kinseyi]|uniref:probable RNA-binding protein CG14230 isoform X2 n=1 Tax=Belonocnema kinseyi TaxID=2817044 RepID=UPI00143DD4BB|nr:probable RNA-binding protein CG14230 isoform X2 [Belonocnema kinseyi]